MRYVVRAMMMIMAILLAACDSDSLTQEPIPLPEVAFDISDGGHGGEVPGFFWLTPTVKKGQKTFTGTFDPDLTPNIDICPIASDVMPGALACSGPVIRTLSGASQPEIIRVDLDKENYSVTWQSTNANDIVVGGMYRAVLRVGARELGWVDLQAVARQGDVSSVPPDYVGLVVGHPFLFKFRIETGIPGAVVITPAAATIKDNQTQLFTAVVTDLHGDLLPGVIVDWSIDDGAIAALGPASGITDGAGETTSTAIPAIGVGGTTTVRANSQGAEGTATLTVKLAVGSVTVTPADPTIWDDETQVFTATVRDLLNNPLPGATVDWTIVDATIATLSPASGTSDGSGQTATTATPAGTAGTTTVRATADGVSGTTTLTVKAACAAGGRDTDGDRLLDCYETNTRIFVSATNTGTDPNDPDTDGDFIDDGDEVLGTTNGLNLPALGTNPLRRDILLEYDWFDDNLDPGTCGAHSHRPTAGAITRLNNAFAAAPIVNPDGSTGVNVINDYGQGGLFTGGNLINDADGVIAGGVNGTDFDNHKAANFAANRQGYFHYVLMPHRYNTNSTSSGQAELPGNDLIVSLYCYNSDVNVANTIMHELGHNLNLRHGGFEDLNWKPNYNSVMNYKYQFPGIDNNCTPPGDGVLTFSVGTRPALDENNLDERQGVCGNPPGPGWDWNGDGDALDFGFARDINLDSSGAGDGLLNLLRDYNDWANLNLGGLGDADGVVIFAVQEIVSCENPAKQ